MQPIFSFFKFLANAGIFIVKLLPIAFIGIILCINLFNASVTAINERDASIFVKEFAITIFSADYNIKQQVDIAKNNPESFGIMNYMEIITSILIIYYITKFIGKGLIALAGAQATFMAYVIGFIIVCIVEMSVVAFIEGEFIYPMSGIVSMITNFDSLWNPDFFRPFKTLQSKYLNISNINNSI